MKNSHSFTSKIRAEGRRKKEEGRRESN